MDQARKIFTDDVKEKKIISRSARSKAKKWRGMTLPQDRMTASQLKGESGEMSVYNLTKPMSWKKFKSMSSDLQREYLEMLLQFDVRATNISKELDWPITTLRKKFAEFGFVLTRRNASDKNIQTFHEWASEGMVSKAIQSPSKNPKRKTSGVSDLSVSFKTKYDSATFIGIIAPFLSDGDNIEVTVRHI